jgi:hypothetical protein
MQSLFGKQTLHMNFLLILMSYRLQEETAKVEKCLLEGSFTEAIVNCFNTPKANAFDHNLLEPLQKLLRLSPPVAASLARPELFSGLLQKLNNKKAVIRLNLLRIVRSICDPNEQQANTIRRHGLFDAVQDLAEHDPAVLVRNMASELVKTSVEKEKENGSGGRIRYRRSSSYTPPSLPPALLGTPVTPTHKSRPSTSSTSSVFIDGSVTPRRTTHFNDNGDAVVYRPKSRDSPILARRTSVDSTNGTPGQKSRLPRTSILRSSRSSMAAPTLHDPGTGGKDNGLRTRSGSKASVESPARPPSSRRRYRPPSDAEVRWPS